MEVYILPDHANASIPPHVREQFQRDEQGRVLFFTAPPVNRGSNIVQKEGRALGHSARYLAAKAKRDAERAAKRKADEVNATSRAEATKKARIEAEEKLQKGIAELRVKAMRALEDQLASATKNDFQMLIGNVDDAHTLTKSLDRLVDVQAVTISKRLEREAEAQKQKSKKQIPITGMTARLEEKV